MFSSNNFQKILVYSFYALFFLVPLIMTPWNFELFEYNKMMLVYFLTVIIAGAWLTRMILVKKVLLARTPFDIPIVLFFLSQFLSTFFSLDFHTSVWGYYSRFHGGLLSTISYILLYYAFVSNFKKENLHTLLKWFLISGLLVSFYGILEHFGIDAQYWVQDVQNRVFSTLGQPNWLAAWIAILMPIPLALGLNVKIKDQNVKLQRKIQNYFNFKMLFLFLIFALCLYFTKSRSGIPAAFIGLAVFGFLYALPKVSSLKKQLLLPLTGVFLLIVLGIGFWGVRTLFRNSFDDLSYIFGLTNNGNIPIHQVNNPGSQSSDIRKVVWRGAFKIFQAYPVFGSGVETFAYSYYNFRPVEHNNLSEWDFLYNKAHNEYFNFLATTGAFGLGTYLLFISWVIFWYINQFKVQNEKLKMTIQNSNIDNFKLLTLNFALLSGWITILITNFFGFSVVPVALCFFLFPAFSYLLTLPDSNHEEIRNQKSEIINSNQKISLVIIILTCSYFLLSIIQFWYADKLYADGLKLDKQGYFAVALDSLKKASSINSAEPLYHDELGWNEANLAVLAITNKQQQLAVDFATNALAQSDQALKTSPKSLNYHKTRVKIYLKLAQIDQTYYKDALDSLKQATLLAPTDPKLTYNLGLVYYQLGQKQEAYETLSKALVMKPAYNEARVAFDALRKEVRGKISP